MIDFKLAGAFLPEKEKAELKTVKETLAQTSQKFSENLLDATNAYGLLVEDKKDLVGIPEDDIASFKETAQSENREDYKITLQVPHYLAVLQSSTSRNALSRLCHARL